mgnify:CR=1 FL=1
MCQHHRAGLDPDSVRPSASVKLVDGARQTEVVIDQHGVTVNVNTQASGVNGYTRSEGDVNFIA